MYTDCPLADLAEFISGFPSVFYLWTVFVSAPFSLFVCRQRIDRVPVALDAEKRKTIHAMNNPSKQTDEQRYYRRSSFCSIAVHQRIDNEAA
jgi:hypothetical protein